MGDFHCSKCGFTGFVPMSYVHKCYYTPTTEFTSDPEHMKDIMDVHEKEVNTYKSILPEAQKLVHGNRQANYGKPIDNFTLTGVLWGAYLGIGTISPEDVAILKVLMKVAREKNKHLRENMVDGAGYFDTAEMIHFERERREHGH